MVTPLPPHTACMYNTIHFGVSILFFFGPHTIGTVPEIPSIQASSFRHQSRKRKKKKNYLGGVGGKEEGHVPGKSDRPLEKRVCIVPSTGRQCNRRPHDQ